MTRRVRAAWALVGLTIALAGVHTWWFLAWSQVRVVPGWPVLPIGAILIACLGALIVGHLPRHRIGWLFLVTGFSVSASSLLAVSDRVLTAEGIDPPRSLDVVLTWLTFFTDLPVPALEITLMFLLFPDGRLPGRRWRPLLWATWGSFLLFSVTALAFLRPESSPENEGDATLSGIAGALVGVLAVSVLIEALAAAGSSVVRYRGARGQERRQLRWLPFAAFGVSFAFGFSLFGETMGLHGTTGTWIRVTPLHVTFVAIPVAAGVAVLRHRLYGIEALLSRAIVLTTVTVLVATGYIGVVVTLGAVLGRRADERFWPSLLAFVLVAVGFQWARRSVLHFADRLVYGPRAAPYEALADFSSGVGVAPSTEQLLPLIAETVGRSVGARRTSVSLEVAEAENVTLRSAAYPHELAEVDRPGVSEVVVQVRDREEVIGQLRLQVERPLTQEQRRLAEDLAEQAAIALRNLRLEAELSERVRQLSTQTAELELSRRRLVAARDDERHRLAAALSREVVRHLEAMPEDLDRLARDPANSSVSVEALLEHHIAAAGDALTVLRKISRGLVPQQPTHRRAVLGRTPPS
jgi:hypothetical protein